MEPGSSTTPRRWKVYVLQAVLLAVSFAVGRYWSTHSAETKIPWSARKVSGSHDFPAKASALSPAEKLVQAKAELAKILRLRGIYDREQALLFFAAGLDPQTIQGLLADLKSAVDKENNKQAITILLGQWAEADPQAALNALKDIHNAYAKGLATSIFASWSAKDPAAALAAISQLPTGNSRGDAFKAVLENMMAQDPASALSALQSQLLASYSTRVTEDIFGELANVYPSATAAAALNLPPSSLRNSVLGDVASAWAAQDPAAALAWANALPTGQVKNDTVKSALETMSYQDPAGAATFVLQLPNDSNRDSLIEDVTESWAQADPVGLLKWAGQNLTDGDYTTAAYNSLTAMGETNPADEVAALAQISDPKVIDAAERGLARNWAEQDVQAALAWAQSLPSDNPSTRSAAISNILNVWAGSDPVNAAAYLQTLTGDPAFNKLANLVINSWGGSDPQAALAWVQNLPPGPAQNTALETALAQLANVDPLSAIDAAGQLTGGTKGRARVNVFDTWSSQQPADAAAALATMNSAFSSSTTLNSAYSTVAKNWLNQDPQAATQWINTLPAGAPRDNAVMQIVSTVGQTDPASAFTWALAIGGPNNRNTSVVKLATQWSGQNPTAAAAAAQNALNTLTGLTDAQTTALQNIAAKVAAP